MKRGVASLLSPFVFVLCLVALNGCGNNLQSSSLKIALLDQAYSDNFIVSDDPFTWDANTALLVTSGSLPSGIDLTGNGELIGTPTQVGDFNFRVTAYSYSYDVWSDDGDDVDADSEWYTLFVTEANTNPLCPNPDDEVATEIFICLGTLERDNLATGSELDLDVNYFIDFNKGNGYDVFTLDFSVLYDDTNFSAVDDLLNSQILREAATRTDASVSFDSQPGELRVVVSASTKNLHKSGRLIDIPFTAIQDVAAGASTFTVMINSIGQQSTKNALPNFVEIDGTVTVTDGVYEDVATE